MEMIKIINENKAKKQESISIENKKRIAKKEKISTLITFLECAAWGFVLAEVITLIVK